MMSVLAGAVLLGAPQDAEACGGFFCDGGPQPMPVDQTGEDILFVMDDAGVEVHIRVEYDGEAENFAWIIPVSSVPTDFNVGSEALIDAVKAASVPTYGITNTADDCSLDDAEGFGDTDASPGEGGFGTSGATGGDSGDGDDGGGPVVLAEETVGAFDITVIGEGEGQELTAQQVFDWLGENGYQQDEAALPIIEEYLQEDHSFAAIKLNGSAGVDELHPIALKFDHAAPCVPLRLTRIAASDDMDVRAYFLADDRVVPQTYKHVLVNPLKIDWINQAANYKEVITKAVDAESAEGRAFVTEYAGGSEVIDTWQLYQEQWDASAFEGLAAIDVINTLQSQGLFSCQYDWELDDDVCFGTHALIEGLLIEFLVPEGMDPREFYNDPAAFQDAIDLERWNNGADFAQRMRERIIEPGLNARDLVRNHDYLTRMYTTISPSEMTKDPMFFVKPDLEEVPNIRTATNRSLCNGDNVWTLPDGREVYVPLGESWPDIGGDEFWEEEVDEMSDQGAPMILVDNSQAINEQLRAYNTAQGWDGSGENGGVEGGDAADDEDALARGGCGCTTSDPVSGAVWSLGFLVGFGVIGRRRRRR
ncbi:MAG: DUF2330 domain-containing protein [Myxococcota bacterium]